MNILQQIIMHKQSEVADLKQTVSIGELMDRPGYSRKCYSLVNRLKHQSGVIAEFKRRSPSKGAINMEADPVDVARGYEEGGATGMSILTDTHFFGGRSNDLEAVRNAVDLPLLRKDFIIDRYQLIEAKAMGADVVLLIAANLDVGQCADLASEARSLGLEVLLELHAEEELGHVNSNVSMVGINNRNLKTFEVDIAHSIRMAEQLPRDTIRIAESGLSDLNNILRLREHGFQGFLIGEYFMKTTDPAATCRALIQSMK